VSQLVLSGIEKHFGGVHALKGVDFDLEQGEVHALVGENGAGKSTLIKILSGVHAPDGGRLALDGRPLEVRGPRQAQELGVATIYQESSLYPDLSVLENLFMGHQPRTRLGTLDWPRMQREAGEVFERLAIRVPPNTRAGSLSRAQNKLVEVARALLRRARIIVMDEPTAALPADDVDRLFEIVAGLSASGVSIVYISHRLDEVFRVADRVTVLRDGSRVASDRVANVDHDWIIRNMVGRTLENLYPHTPREPGRVLLQVRGLTRAGVFEDISLTLREGEIVGLAGLVGSGRSEVARALFGIDRYDSGEVLLEGEPVPTRPWQAVDAGLALLPEDRAGQGLILPFALRKNISLAMLPRLNRRGFIDDRSELELARKFIDSLRIRTPGPHTPTHDLSGGNQQKVVLAKWLALAPRVLILDEPTQGVDVGAKAEIHQLIDELVQQGVAILLISSDLEEILGMSDRVLVMHGGRLVAELPRGSSAEAVMRPATGLGSHAHEGAKQHVH
jgi:rhamnose transport system ATP-binding protein